MKTEKTIIFGCPIYIIKVDPNSYDKQSLLKTIESNYSKDSYRNKFDKDQSNLHHSFSDELNPKFEKVDYNKVGLVDVYKKIFDNFCNNTLKTKDRFSYEYKIENYTASNKNQYFRSHHHLPTADFSSVHYIKFDKAQHEKTNFLIIMILAHILNFLVKDFMMYQMNQHQKIHIYLKLGDLQ